MEARHRLIDEELADSPLYQARALLGEWCAKQHGRAAEQAFDEIRDDILPEIEALRRGGPTIAAEDFAPPRYWSDTWFHRTDRKSVVSGTSVSVSANLGGLRIFTQKIIFTLSNITTTSSRPTHQP